MAPMCSECENEIPPYSGKRRYTCSPECSRARTRRHPGRDYTQKPCSECGGECPRRLSKGRPFVTCGEECARSRRRRLDAERAPRRVQRQCADCGESLSGLGARAERCLACSLERRRTLASIRHAQRRAERLSNAEAIRLEADRRSNSHLMRLYGITRAEFEAMKDRQGGLCAICGREPIGRGKGNVLVVDHCHRVGTVRGLLCGNCNIAIGLLDDSPDLLTKAAAYLR